MFKACIVVEHIKSAKYSFYIEHRSRKNREQLG